ncbi:recombinase family protein [Bacteroides fragilis]|nr:recombinase family protein [Bacteroides fragilis]MCS2878858.1 recombinase family protein [Bacteroides fragilis]
MAKVGYIFRANNAGFDAEREWMQQYGCVQIIEETVEHETLRPLWKQLMSNLRRGDELVVSKFSNAVRGLRELAAFIEICRIKIVRVISIHDRVDTRGELFPDTTVADVLWIIGAFPEEIAALRNFSTHIEKLRQNIKAPVTPQVLAKADREKLIVDMYINGHSFNDILAASGFSSKSSIWRILNKHNVKLDRGQTSGPRVKQKPKEDETAEGNS